MHQSQPAHWKASHDNSSIAGSLDGWDVCEKRDWMRLLPLDFDRADLYVAKTVYKITKEKRGTADCRIEDCQSER